MGTTMGWPSASAVARRPTRALVMKPATGGGNGATGVDCIDSSAGGPQDLGADLFREALHEAQLTPESRRGQVEHEVGDAEGLVGLDVRDHRGRGAPEPGLVAAPRALLRRQLERHPERERDVLRIAPGLARPAVDDLDLLRVLGWMEH